MNPERVCYGCFEEKEPGEYCIHCGFNETKEEQPYLALPLGTILNGRYLTGKVLGIGGFGITYLGYDLTLEIKVAIKEYMPSALATRHADHYSVALTGRVEDDYQNGMARFLDEAKILAKLQNTPNIVSVQNYFKENNTAYFVMEYVDGMSLKAYLEQNGGQLPYSQAIAILQPIMEALVQVHARNLLHRDISPDNIYITSTGESRLLDFGAARFALGDGKSVSVILKHGYAPEEQYSTHGNQGPWTDVYAMGATLYRCITGQLPPDAVERIHGDTIKTPSELGIRIPPNVERAIMKALAVRTEDRLPNMEAFLAALGGRTSVQEQVAASVSQRTQAKTYGQNSYNPSGYGQTVYQPAANQRRAVPSRKPSGFLAYLKANPLVAGLSGVAVLAVVVLCVILAFSGGKKKGPTGGPGGTPVTTGPQMQTITEQTNIVATTASTEPPTTAPTEPPTTAPTRPPVQMVTRDLGALNATIDVPEDFTVDDNGMSFYNDDRNCALTLTYIWNSAAGPIYTLSDVESQREQLLDLLMEGTGATSYELLTAGSDRVGGTPAYQIYAKCHDNDLGNMDVVVMAVDAEKFGCYLIFALYGTGDEAGKEEIHSIIQSFKSTGRPQTTYMAYRAERAGVKVIVDESLAKGGIVDMELTLNMNGIGTVYEMFLFATEADKKAGVGRAPGVEISKASEFNVSTPEGVIQYQKGISRTNGGTYTFTSGGVEWLAYDFVVNGWDFSYAAAMIDGECILVGCMYKSSSKEVITQLYNQAIASVRPVKG